MSEDTTKVYSVEGMTCGHCESSVREEVEELDGVEYAQADRSTGLLTVRGKEIDDAAVRAAVQAAGYAVLDASAPTAEEAARP